MRKLKAYCSYCPKEVGEKDRIFEYNKDTIYLTCPNCGKQLNPIEAHHAYLSFIRRQVHKGDNYLDFYGKYEKAYKQYAYVLSIEDSSIEAGLGRLLALAYLSTLRKAYFNECLTLLENEEEYYTYTQKDLYTFLYFAKNMRFMAKSYAAQIKKRLTTYRYFYDENCVKLYFQRIYELKRLLSGILDELTTIKEEIANNDTLNKSFDSYSAGVVKFGRLLTADANVIDGSVLNFDHMEDNGEIVLKLKKKYQLNHMFKYRHMYLYSDSKRHLIKDDVFQFSNPLLVSLRTWTLVLFASLIIAGGSAIASVSLIMTKWIYLAFLFGSAGFLGLAFISLIVIAFTRRKIKKVKRGTSH